MKRHLGRLAAGLLALVPSTNRGWAALCAFGLVGHLGGSLWVAVLVAGLVWNLAPQGPPVMVQHAAPVQSIEVGPEVSVTGPTVEDLHTSLTRSLADLDRRTGPGPYLCIGCGKTRVPAGVPRCDSCRAKDQGAAAA